MAALENKIRQFENDTTNSWQALQKTGPKNFEMKQRHDQKIWQSLCVAGKQTEAQQATKDWGLAGALRDFSRGRR